MRRNMAMIAGLLGAALLSGGMGQNINTVHPSEPSRGWNGFVGDSKKSRNKKTNKLRCAHKAKLKRRMVA